MNKKYVDYLTQINDFLLELRICESALVELEAGRLHKPINKELLQQKIATLKAKLLILGYTDV